MNLGWEKEGKLKLLGILWLTAKIKCIMRKFSFFKLQFHQIQNFEDETEEVKREKNFLGLCLE